MKRYRICRGLTPRLHNSKRRATSAVCFRILEVLQAFEQCCARMTPLRHRVIADEAAYVLCRFLGLARLNEVPDRSCLVLVKRHIVVCRTFPVLMRQRNSAVAIFPRDRILGAE
jgi:hypothetical protein